MYTFCFIHLYIFTFLHLYIFTFIHLYLNTFIHQYNEHIYTSMSSVTSITLITSITSIHQLHQYINTSIHQYITLRCVALQYSTVQYNTIQYNTCVYAYIECNAMLCYVVLWYFVCIMISICWNLPIPCQDLGFDSLKDKLILFDIATSEFQWFYVRAADCCWIAGVVFWH